MSNKGLFTDLGIVGLGLAFAAPADAQLLARKDLSLAAALAIASTAADLCKSQGYAVSVTVVGRNGEVILQMRGDNAPPHTMENSFRKAYSARTFRVPSGELVQRVKDNPTAPFVHLGNVVAAQGALPIKVGDDVIGAVGVSGAPGYAEIGVGSPPVRSTSVFQISNNAS
jgi:uncharacterized protein GlcG (DUF336 family)